MKQSASEFRGGGGGWGSFGQYMRDKTNKLKEQFEVPDSKTSRIFAGLTFWLTGKLDDFQGDIKRLITNNGGVYEQYGMRSVTHIIASNLAMHNQNWSKLKSRNLAKMKFYVVTAQWVVDSINAGKRVSESMYLPKCLQPQGSVARMFGRNSGIRLDSAIGASSKTEVVAKPDEDDTNEDVLSDQKSESEHTNPAVQQETLLCFSLVGKPTVVDSNLVEFVVTRVRTIARDLYSETDGTEARMDLWLSVTIAASGRYKRKLVTLSKTIVRKSRALTLEYVESVFRLDSGLRATVSLLVERCQDSRRDSLDGKFAESQLTQESYDATDSDSVNLSELSIPHFFRPLVIDRFTYFVSSGQLDRAVEFQCEARKFALESGILDPVLNEIDVHLRSIFRSFCDGADPPF